MYKFLTSNITTSKSKEIRRLILLNGSLVLASFTAAIFVFFNFFVTQNMSIVFLNLIGALIGVVLFFELRLNKNLDRSSTLAVIVLASYFMFFTFFNQNDGHGLFWIPVFAVFAIGILGTKKSLFFLAPYFLFVFALAFDGIGEWQNGAWDMLGFIRFVFSSMLITFIVVVMDLALLQSDKNFEKISTIDALTNIHNRGSIQERILDALKESKRHTQELSLVLFDIDDFKKINDTKGHRTGDNVLKKIAKETQKELRARDSFGRWGGEEFLIVLPQTSQDEALLVAQKIRHLIEELTFDADIKVSCSFGVATCENEHDSYDSLFERADRAMYRAKELGKNRVESL